MTDLKESRHLKALKDKLREMFQLDQADLDFGIYRIMNQKRDEIERFLDKDLLPQVREALQDYQPADLIETQRKLEKAVEGAKAAGIDPEQAPNVRQLRAELADSIDISRLEEEIYSHLSTFFSRYYQGGDFLSLRRYKEGVYALPYEGEEVKLHWANADQYYIKSTEAFRSYAFKVKQASPAEAGATNSARDRRVRFDLVSAGTERDNTKAVAGKERRFVLDQQVPLEMDGDELVIRFHYRPDDEKRKQKDLNAEAVAALLGLLDGAPATIGISEWDFWQGALAEKAPTDANANRTVLEKHLTDYTARNSFDYFIHKDLGGFLRRELDFFIKNEVMFLDDIESDTAPRVEQYLSKIRVLRKIAHKIIAFLAQLENFQKKLWLKKKFVLETNWLVTLDKVPEELYPEIAANDAQREEWVRLFAIDEIRGDLGGDVAYSVPLTVAFLQANPFLVLDTAFFGQAFKDALLAVCEDIEEETGGLLVHGDNFQSINNIKKLYHNMVDYSYIDPPYNTGDDGFMYKDSYRHSSWMTMMADRIRLVMPLMSEKSVSSISIDRDEDRNLLPLCFQLFGDDNFIEEIIWQKAYGGGAKTKLVNNLHEYVVLFAKNKNSLPHFFFSPDPDSIKYYKYIDEKEEIRGKYRTQPLATNSNDARDNLTYPLPCPICEPSSRKNWKQQWEQIRSLLQEGRLDVVQSTDGWLIELIDENGNKIEWWGRSILPPMQWQWGWSKAKEALINNELIYEKKSSDWVVNYKQYRFDEHGNERGRKPPSIMVGPYTQRGTDEVRGLFGFDAAKFPKPLGLIKDLVSFDYANKKSLIIDFFAGSGTTGQAVIDLNREDNGRRKFVLVETGSHFDSVLKHRISKSVHSSHWENGKPTSRNGISHLAKYIRLESYEDCLDNLSLSRTAGQQQLLDQHDRLREEYMLHYMVDVETEGSLLDTRSFDRPFDYTLSVVRDDERKTVPVDLVETFNYLLGLRVKTRDRKRGVLEIIGLSPEGEMVLVLWRNVDEVDSDALDEWFRKQGYNSRDLEFQTIYINGDNNIENQRQTDETWKVRLIEEHFHKLMFDVEGM